MNETEWSLQRETIQAGYEDSVARAYQKTGDFDQSIVMNWLMGQCRHYYAEGVKAGTRALEERVRKAFTDEQQRQADAAAKHAARGKKR